MAKLILIMYLIFVILLIIGIGWIVFVIRKPKPSAYTIKRSNSSGVRFGFSFIVFIQALIGGSIFLLIMYVADLYPEKELITFGVPLLFAFAMGAGFASKK